MLKCKKVAITGGIASGKSKFCSYLEKLGAYFVSADKIVHQLLSLESDLRKQVIQLLGPSIVQQGEINRKRVAEIVFCDPEMLEKLEKITHPEVMKRIEQDYNRVSKKGDHPLFIAEIPLLFEVGANNRFDKTITVIAKEKQCIDRLTKIKGTSPNEYQKRMARQLSQEEKAKRADIVALNNSSLKELEEEAKKIYNKLITNQP